jgi:UPF0716 protein FxsA
MTVAGGVLTFLDRDFLFKLILVLLAWSLIPLGEVFFFIYLASLIGNSLVLILAAVTGAVGAGMGVSQARRAVSRLKAASAAGGRPGADVADLVGLFASALLMITPGFVTDVAGLLLLVPALRGWLGRKGASFLTRRAPVVSERLGLFSTA